MALSVDYIYQFALRLIRKNQSGSVSALEFADFWNSEQNAYMADLLGRFQRNSNGKSGTNTGLIQNETILEKLWPFTQPSALTPSSGVITKPTDFVYTLALTINGSKVVHINHNQLSDVSASVIDPPSIPDSKYYYKEYLGFYSILPLSNTTDVDVVYIRQPADVVWAYTFDGSGRQVYNAGGSTDPEWGDIDSREITKRMLKTIGVSLAAKDFEQFGDSVINTGN